MLDSTLEDGTCKWFPVPRLDNKLASFLLKEDPFVEGGNTRKEGTASSLPPAPRLTQVLHWSTVLPGTGTSGGSWNCTWSVLWVSQVLSVPVCTMGWCNILLQERSCLPCRTSKWLLTPKSASLIIPVSRSRRTFADLISRCTRPFAWRYSRPWATCLIMLNVYVLTY